MKKLLSLTALGLALTLGFGAHAAEDAKAPTKQQSKMATCNKDAGDMKGDERSSIVDAAVTNVVGGNLVKVAAWYDNEWGYACRLSDLCAFIDEKGL